MELENGVTSNSEDCRPPRFFGGKRLLSKRYLNLIPEHHTYVEPCSGMANLLFIKEPSPIEVINDLDSDIVNFFRVLRDPSKFEKLRQLLSLTPYSREEHRSCSKGYERFENDIMRAWAWYTAVVQSRNGLLGSSWSRDVHGVASGMSKMTSAWLRSIDKSLPQIHLRLRRVQLEHQDFRKVIRKFDGPRTFFYIDPPYVPETRSRGHYRHEMSLADHLDLIDLVLDVKGMVLLSGYNNNLYQLLLPSGWIRRDIPTFCFSSHKHVVGENGTLSKPRRMESVWLSPSLVDALRTTGTKLREA